MTTGTGRRLDLRLPLPPRALSPNGPHRHWSAHADAARGYRTGCYLAIAAGYAALMAADLWRVRLSLVFTYCGRQHVPDLDNCIASFKPGQDALTDAGLIHDDSAKWLSYGGIEAQHCPRGCTCGGYVAVTVEEVQA